MSSSYCKVFTKLEKKTRDLAKSQAENDLPAHKLKTDCTTRWGSTYDMIARISEQQRSICVVLATDRKSVNFLSSLDFDVIDSMISVLKPLRKLTDALAAEKRVSVSAVKPLVQSICNKVLALSDEDTDLAKEMKSRIKSDLLQRYSEPEIDKLLSRCCLVDPRFKKRLSEDVRQVTIAALKRELSELDEGETSQEVTITSMEPPCKRSALSRILDDEPEHAVSVQTTIAEKVNNEFDIYMQMPVANTDQSPLDWWKKEELQFPLLSKLARKY